MATTTTDATTSGTTAPANAPGTHSFVVSGTRFDVAEHYKLIKPIGHGAYGVVVSANDEKNKDKVAIKKVPRAFDDLIDAKRILREIKLLRHFDHENVSVIEKAVFLYMLFFLNEYTFIIYHFFQLYFLFFFFTLFFTLFFNPYWFIFLFLIGFLSYIEIIFYNFITIHIDYLY
jgi:serine/threonine protein kinase